MNNRDFSVGDYDSNLTGKYNEDSWDSSENYDRASGDDDHENGQRISGRRRKYHRHTGHQIQELEADFLHPDEKQRLELSRRLSLETNQVKFWFQNRRTQMKTQMERHQKFNLKQENDKLRIENIALKDAVRNPLCQSCGGSAPISDISYEEHHLRVENAKMEDEINRLSILPGLYVSRPSVFSVNHTTPLGTNSRDFHSGLSVNNEAKNASMVEIPFDKPTIFELAMAAMEELTKKIHLHAPLWIKSMDGETSFLSYEEYYRIFPPCIGTKPAHFVVDATRQGCLVNVDSEAIVETFMDVERWSEMFRGLVSKAIMIEEISQGINGTKDGALQIIQAELQVLSPLVAPRAVKFLRFCKQHGDGMWAVVDMSIDNIRSGHSFNNSRRLPSGCVVQDMANGYSKVIWVEHSEYDPTGVPTMYRQVVSSGIGYGAQRWLSTLQRQCESLLVLPSNPPLDGLRDPSQAGRTNLLKLAQKMVDQFCAGICVSPTSQWTKIHSHHLGEDVKVMTRNGLNIPGPGELPGVILSASTSLWMPVPMQRLYDFLRDEQMRSAWDILSDGGQSNEMIHIRKSQYHNNGVSLIHAPAMEANQASMFVLQETWMDASGSLVVYAPVDMQTITSVLDSGDPSFVALLPSGFTIHPAGQPVGTLVNRVHSWGDHGIGGNGSLLTVGFQIFINSLPSTKLSSNSLETVDCLLSCTVEKIKAAFDTLT